MWSTFSNTSAPGERLGWRNIDPQEAGSDSDIANAVIDNGPWIVVVGEYIGALLDFLCSLYFVLQWRQTPLVVSQKLDRMETRHTTLEVLCQSTTHR